MTEGPWAARVAISEASAASALRQFTDVRAATADGEIWLRGEAMNESLNAALRRLSPAMRYHVAPDGGLIPEGRLLPAAQLPADVLWRTLEEFFTVERRVAGLAGTISSRCAIRIVRSESERSASILIARWETWADWAQTASAIRLAALQFAATQHEALIRGIPLSPLPGRRFYERSGIAVPCGFDWSPEIDPDALREVLGLNESDLAVFAEDGAWQLVPASSFVEARRSAVRLTSRGASA